LPGYEVVSLSVPFGEYPKDETWLVRGAYQGRAYEYQGAVKVGGGLTVSPYSADFNAFRISRVQATHSELDYWLSYANQPGVHYVSPGE
jgi:hypothetical protein